jgi:pheromone shutdown protein TraB
LTSIYFPQRQSGDEVRELVRAINPDVVFVSLCNGRQTMLNPIKGRVKKPTMWGLADIRKHGIFQVLLHNYMARASTELDISPGEEFRVAAAEAMNHDAKIMLGDRPVQVTLQRAWFSLTRYERLKLAGRFLFSSYGLPGAEELTELVTGEHSKHADLMTAAVREVGKEFPLLTTTLIDERDLYMVRVLRFLHMLRVLTFLHMVRVLTFLYMLRVLTFLYMLLVLRCTLCRGAHSLDRQ